MSVPRPTSSNNDEDAPRLTFPHAGPRDATEPFDLMAQHRVACMAGVVNPFVPEDLQVLTDACLDGARAIGHNVELMTRLVPPLVAQRLDAMRGDNPALDYRAYSINFADPEIQRVMFGEMDMGSPAADAPATKQRDGALRLVVEQWTQAMLAQLPQKGTTIFRRSLIVCLQASFLQSSFACRDEHALTLALEARTPDTLRLLIFDHHTADYHYPVHAQLQEWMATVAGRVAPAFRFVTREVVCLEDHIHEDEFMACMPAAYRVCLLLAGLDEPARIDESDADFENSEMYLHDELVRMLNWLDTNADIAAKRVTVLASRTLSLPFYELSHRDGGLFLYLMPYRFFAPPYSSSAAPVTDRARIFDALEAAGVPRLCYDPARGLVVVPAPQRAMMRGAGARKEKKTGAGTAASAVYY